MNSIENCGYYIEIHSHINYDAIKIMEGFTNDKTEWIQFWCLKENKNDVEILNEYFKNHKEIRYRFMENWMIPLLPELERFGFEIENINDKTLELLKNNKVKALYIENSPNKKYDLMKLVVFKDTLEEISIEGNYKNLETLIDETANINIMSLKFG